jgi:hypothetical protein
MAVSVLVVFVDLVVAYMNGVGHVSEERLLGAKAHLLIMVISSYTKAIKGHWLEIIRRGVTPKIC